MENPKKDPFEEYLGKRSVNWDDVKNYLETYVGEFYEIADTKGADM